MNASGPTGRLCTKCGAPIATEAPKGICPRCELHGALELLTGEAEAVANTGKGRSEEASDPHRADSLTRSPSDPMGEGSPGRTGSVGRRFGNYELLEEIARGGMGVVYRARQVTLNRIVAVKMILAGQFAGKQFAQRFREEAAAAGVLQHPNIVAVHDVGIEDGQHYFSMDYVEGQNLARLVGQRPLPPNQAAQYVRLIAEAVHYAHEQGILHRDLKPSNVLIDANDRPRVTDFGLAKRFVVPPSGGPGAIGPAEAGSTSFDLTLTGQMIGSPSFMPPEQASAGRGKVGRYSDVYGLGGILYFLLTARAPFQAESLEATVTQVLNAEPISPRLLNASVPRDLETICLKCLEKEPAKRYPTARALADELGRLLKSEPIHARPVGPAGKAWRWCRRKPALAGAFGGLLVVLWLGLAGTLWQWRRAETSATHERREHVTAEGRLYAAQMKLAHAAWKAGKSGGALELLKAQIPLPDQPDFRGFDWRYLYRLCASGPGEIIATNASGFQAVDYSPDAATVAFGTGDGYVELLEVQTRQRVKRWPAHRGATDFLAFHPRHHNWLATVSGYDGVLKLWDIVREHPLLSTNVGRGMSANFTFSPSGRFLATRGTDAQSVDLWEFDAGATAARPSLTLRTNLGFWGPTAFSPDERTLVVCNQMMTGEQRPILALFDLANNLLTSNLPEVHIDTICAVAFSPNGRTLATGAADERVVVWDVEGWAPVRTHRSDFINVSSIVFTPNGRTLFAGSWDQNLRSWDLQDAAQMNVWRGHSGAVNRLAVAPDGQALVSASNDGTARLWPLATAEFASALPPHEECVTLFRPRQMLSPQREPAPIFSIAVSPAQDRTVACDGYQLILCDLGTEAVTTVPAANLFEIQGPRVGLLKFSPDGRTLAVASGDGRVAFLDAITLVRSKNLGKVHDGQITHMAYALNGTALVTGGGFGTGLKLIDVASGTNLWEMPDPQSAFQLQALTVSPDGKLLATGGTNQCVMVWDLAARRMVAQSPQKVRFLHDAAFAPDGRALAFSDELGAIFFWDLSGHEPVRKLVGHPGPALALAFSPDGRTLASGGMDHTIRLWHPDIGQEVAILTGHTQWIWCLAFAEHGNALLSGSRDGTLRLWRALSFEQIDKQLAAQTRGQ